MRLVVVGHTYSRASAQGKFVALKRRARDLQLRLVTPVIPPQWGVGGVTRYEVSPELSAEEVIALPRVWGRSNPTYGLSPTRLVRALRSFEPDHIHIEEDLHSFIAVEAVLLARLVCPRAGISFFTWDNIERSRHFPLNEIKWLLSRITLAHTDFIVCGNREAQRLLARRGYHGPSAVLPQTGQEPADYASAPRPDVRERIAAQTGEVVIGHLGRLVPEKGTLLLLEALEPLQDWSWKIVMMGAGPLRREIDEVWQPRLGERLLRLEPVPRREVAEYVKCLDVLVLPSYGVKRWKEQFGEILAQAMMAGVACVGSASGAIPDVIGPGGLIVRERSVAGLTDALRFLLSNPEERTRLGAAGRAHALAHYTNDVLGAEYLALFRQITTSKKGRSVVAGAPRVSPEEAVS